MLGLPLPSLDTLLSLPLISLLVLPSALSSFSWTTSLNILFFYITWGSIVLSHKPLNIELFGTLAARAIFYLAPSLVFLAFDLSVPSASASIKQHGKRGLPSKAVRSGAPARLLKYVGVCIGNLLLGVALQSLLEYVLIHLLNMRSALKITSALPFPLGIAKDLSKAYLIRGPLSYYIHRYLLHSRRDSPILTKWHADWNHSLETTLPLSSSYDHPIVYLLHRWLPIYLPAVLFRMHMLTYLLFVALICLEEAFAWSGYNVLPSTVMLAGMARRTEAHIMKDGTGNFGPFGVMDWIHSTAMPGSDVMDDVQTEVSKHDVKGKAKDAAHRASDAAGDALQDDDDAAPGAEDDQEGVVSRARSRTSKTLRGQVER